MLMKDDNYYFSYLKSEGDLSQKGITNPSIGMIF